MNPISIQVNGRGFSRQAEPRMHPGDFLRDELRLTGTHLGCEHGVCGACTVLVNGQPTRSCITFAVACEGQEVTTIEGYDDDAVMQTAASGVHAPSRTAVRFLHTRNAHHGARHRAAPAPR